MWPSKPHVNIDFVLEEHRQILVFANHAWPWVAGAKKRKRAIKGGTSLHQSPKWWRRIYYWQSQSLGTSVLMCRPLSRASLLCITLGGEEKVTVGPTTDSKWHNSPLQVTPAQTHPHLAWGYCACIECVSTNYPHSLLPCSSLIPLLFFALKCSIFFFSGSLSSCSAFECAWVWDHLLEHE